MKVIVTVILFSLPWVSHAQSYFYNTQQFGLRSTLLGGAVTAGSADLSMIYYNPAALRYARDKGFDFALFMPSYNRSVYGDKLGSGNTLKARDLSFNPSLLTYKTTIFDGVDIVFTLLQKDLWDTNAQQNFTLESDESVHKNAFSYNYHGDEKWFGLGSSIPITQGISIGVSHFWSLRSTNYSYGLSSENQLVQEDRLKEFYSDQFDLNISSVLSMVTKVGIAIEWNKSKLGAVITSPNYLPYDKSAGIEKATSILDFGRFVLSNTVDFEIDPQIKNSWEFNLGVAQILADSSEIWLKASHHRAVGEYEIFNVSRTNLDPLTFYGGLEAVTNFSLGYSKYFNSKVQLLGSVRTNYSAAPQRINNQREQSVLLLEQDRMHVALGCKILHNSASFVIGLDYGFSMNSTSPPFDRFPSINLLNLQETSHRQNIFTLLLTYEFFLDTMGRNISRMMEGKPKHNNFH